MFGIRPGHHRQHGLEERPTARPGIAIFLREFGRAARRLCFPARCLICGQGLPGDPETRFCVKCEAGIRLLREPCCLKCGRPFFNGAGASHLCSVCLTHDWHYARAHGVICYDPRIAPLIHAVKYHGQTAPLPSFAALKKRLPHLDDCETARVIVPVPLHADRLRRRGYNQSLRLARALFPHLRHRIDTGALERWRPTRPQTGLPGPARRRNIKGAFRVVRPEKIAGQRVLLLDDVYTTGATVNECARVLVQAGAAEVRVLTLARVEE